MMKLVFVAALLSLFLHISQAGSCWETMDSTGMCTSLIRGEMSSKEECCALGVFSWSDADVTDHDLIINNGIKPCEPCGADCTHHRCPHGQVCRMQDGNPKCECHYQCTQQETNWICGTDERPYRNTCEMDEANCHKKQHVEIAYPGTCKETCEQIQCPENTQCVTNRTTKRHRCVDCDDVCESSVQKVFCGTDGLTYQNDCELQRQNCYNSRKNNPHRLAYLGECQVSGKCSTVQCPNGTKCLLNYVTGTPACTDCSVSREEEKLVSVCGSNQQPYKSLGDLKRESCRLGRLFEPLKPPCKRKQHG